MDRSVAAIGATSGSLSALVLRLITEFASAPEHPLSFECPICPELDLRDLVGLKLGDLDPISCLVGLLLGLLLGPLLDLVHLIRHSWRIWIKDKLKTLSREREEPLYKRA